MRRLEARDIKDMNLLKHYRIIRKWACKNNNLNDADLDVLNNDYGDVASEMALDSLITN